MPNSARWNPKREWVEASRSSVLEIEQMPGDRQAMFARGLVLSELLGERLEEIQAPGIATRRIFS